MASPYTTIRAHRRPPALVVWSPAPRAPTPVCSVPTSITRVELLVTRIPTYLRLHRDHHEQDSVVVSQPVFCHTLPRRYSDPYPGAKGPTPRRNRRFSTLWCPI